MRAKEVTEAIKCYMQRDSICLQALVLHGEWGSGKTYYCEHDLKDALNVMNVKTCRVSLFGVNDYDEAINRVIATRLPLSDKAVGSAGAAISALIKNVLKAGSTFVSNKIGDFGIQLSLKPDLLLPLLDMKNVLVIFDDCERSSFAQDDRTFFGFVNNMVENHGWHVMLIRNKPLSFEDDSSVEKAVMSQVMFEPDIQELYRIIAEPQLHIPIHADFSIEKSIIDGLRGSLVNARALSRSVPSINYALSASVLVDKNIDLRGRAEAFSDFVGYTVQASAGKTPKKPNTSNKAVNMIDYSKVMDYEYYLLISEALAPLTEGRDTSPSAVESSFTEYVLAKNPDSAADIKAQSIVDQWNTLRTMEDNQVESLANRLEDLLSDGQYSHRWFPEIVSISLALKTLEFWDETNLEKLLASLKLAASRDPQCSASVLRQEMLKFKDFYGSEVVQILDVLATNIESKERDRHLNHITFEPSIIDQNTGASLSTFLEETIKSQCPRKILSVPAECVVKSIYEGVADSQLSLRSFFHSSMKEYPDDQSLSEAIEWLSSINAQLDEVGSKSRMGRLRSKWIRDDIENAIEALNERVQRISAESVSNTLT